MDFANNSVGVLIYWPLIYNNLVICLQRVNVPQIRKGFCTYLNSLQILPSGKKKVSLGARPLSESTGNRKSMPLVSNRTSTAFTEELIEKRERKGIFPSRNPASPR